MSSAVITMRSHPGHSPTPTTTTSGRPTSSAHMRVPSVSKQGLPRLDDVRHRDNRRAPVPRPGPLPADHPTIRSEAPLSVDLPADDQPTRALRGSALLEPEDPDDLAAVSRQSATPSQPRKPWDFVGQLYLRARGHVD